MSNVKTTTRAAAQDAPADRVATVIPDDAAALPLGVCRALFVGVAGAVTLEDAQGGRVVLTSAGSQYHPIRVSRVLATGTTAEGIVALY